MRAIGKLPKSVLILEFIGMMLLAVALLSASVASITPQEREIAIKAARTMALDVAGVDILRANRGPLVMEVNASPGLEGIEKTTGIDIAGKMIRWIERHATTEYCLKTGG